MILYTCQPIKFVEVLKREGSITTDPSLIDPDFIPSYDWIVQYLEKKSQRPEGVQYPIWGYYRYDWLRSYPNFRYSCNRYDEPRYLLTVEIPDNDVLLSDLELWNYVLNGWFIPKYDTEEECEPEESQYDSIPNESDKIIALKKSWERIFEIDRITDGYIRQGMDIQGIFWKLRIDQVLRIEYIKPKYRIRS